MSSIDSNTRLSEPTIPHTRDSGTYDLIFEENRAICKTMSQTDQASMRIRLIHF